MPQTLKVKKKKSFLNQFAIHVTTKCTATKLLLKNTEELKLKDPQLEEHNWIIPVKLLLWQLRRTLSMEKMMSVKFVAMKHK